MIRFNEVSKVYRTNQGEVRAVDDLTLGIERGEFVALRGPSGCGKSTFLSLAGGLNTATSGKVYVADRELTVMSPAERARFRGEQIGFVFQMFHLLPFLTVLDNVLVAATDGKQLRPKAKELLEGFGMAHRLEHRPAELSTGERQRVAIARALLNDPALVLADEPTGNLDPDNAEGVLDLLSDFQQAGGTVVLATHSAQAAARADRTVFLQDGRLAEPAEQQKAGQGSSGDQPDGERAEAASG